QAIRDGQIGRLETIRIEHGEPFAWPAQTLSFFLPGNGGVFADVGIHYLDLVEQWAGELKLASYCDDSRGGVEAEVEAEFRSSTTVTVFLRLSRLTALSNTITLTGTEGRIELGCESISSLRLHRKGYPGDLEVRSSRPLLSGLPPSFAACFV